MTSFSLSRMNNLLTISKIHNDLIKKARAPLAYKDDDDKPAFEDCEKMNYIYGLDGDIETFYVKKGEPQCFRGSILLGANSTWEISTALKDPETEKYSYTKDVSRGIASLGYSINTTISVPPITKVKCVGADLCKVHVMKVPYSYLFEAKVEVQGIEIETVTGFKSIVSTKKEGEMTFGIRSKSKASSKKVSGETTWTNALISGFNKKSFSFERQRGASFLFSYLKWKNNDLPLKGELEGESTKLKAYATIDIEEFIEDLDPTKFDQKNIKIELLNTLKWKDASKSSKSKAASADEKEDEEEEFLIPEFTATLSTKGGAFDESNVDQEFPTDKNGLSAGAIAGIVIAVILVIAIIAVCVWLFAFGGINKFKKGNDKPSGSGDKKETA